MNVFRKVPKFSNHFIPFKQLGMVGNMNLTCGKVKNPGELSAMLGYVSDHPEGTYRLLNCCMEAVLHSQDLTWSKFYYGELYGNKDDLLIDQ